MVGQALGLPTCLDNDVRAASLEALRLDRPRDPELAHLLLNRGTGVGALPRDHPTGAMGATALPTSGLPLHGGPFPRSSTEGS